MNMETITTEAFSVIGKEGSTQDGPGFVQQLWADANCHFQEIAHLAKRDDAGNLAGIWGAMSDFSRSFAPWEENFSQGLYLAGIECTENAQPPEGWTRWDIPGFTYLRVRCDDPDVFGKTITYLQEKSIPLAGAVQDFTCPQTGETFMLFPIEKL